MYKVLRNYINYMTAWQQENFPSLPTKNAFDIVSHLLYCNGNGVFWLDAEKGSDHLAMQMELKLAGKEGWISFPFCNDETKSVHYTQQNQRDHSYYKQHEHFLIETATSMAWKVNPALADISLNDPDFWVQAVWENFKTAYIDASNLKFVWERYKERPDMLSLGFPYDFNRPVKQASRRFVPILNLLDFSNEHNIEHNSKIFKLTKIINEAVIQVYSEIIDSPEWQENLGENIVDTLRNKLNHFTDFHSKNFFNLEV